MFISQQLLQHRQVIIQYINSQTHQYWMNEEYLNQFNYSQLVNYENLIKRRIKDMKELVVTLEKDNSELSKEYKSLMEEKRNLYLQNKHKQKFWNKIVDSSKNMISNIFVQPKKQNNPYEPKFEQKQEHQIKKQDILKQFDRQTPQQTHEIKKKVQQQVHEIPKNVNQPVFAVHSSPSRLGPVQVSGFNFDDIYSMGKDRLTKMAHASGQKWKDISEYGTKIKQYIKQKVIPVNSSEKRDILNEQVNNYVSESQKQQVDRFKKQSLKLPNNTSLTSYQGDTSRQSKQRTQALITALQYKQL